MSECQLYLLTHDIKKSITFFEEWKHNQESKLKGHVKCKTKLQFNFEKENN